MADAPRSEAPNEKAPYCLKGSRRYCGNRMRQKVTRAAPRPITAMSTCAKSIVSTETDGTFPHHLIQLRMESSRIRRAPIHMVLTKRANGFYELEPRTSLYMTARSRSARAPSPTKTDPCIVANVFGCRSASRWSVGSMRVEYGK